MRLTKKIDNNYYVVATRIDFAKDGEDATTKLGQLEDIEDELGIDLLTLFKALKNGFYFKDNYGDVDFISGNIIKKLNKSRFAELQEKIKYYGITWALTKEELE